MVWFTVIHVHGQGDIISAGAQGVMVDVQKTKCNPGYYIQSEM